MKKLLALLVIVVFSVLVVSPVLAQSITKEKVASRTAILKEKLAKFKDKKKADRVDKINTELSRINQKRTTQMLKFLDNAAKILGKVPGGSSSAQAKIDEARAAVKLQADKDYTIEATSEAKIKDQVKAAHQALKTDLQNLKKLITEAKQAVAGAIREARSGK